LREKVEHGAIELLFCPTEEMIANVLTKALPKFKHQKMFRVIGNSIKISNLDIG